MSESDQQKFQAAQEIARMLSDFRREFVDRLVGDVKKERDAVVESGYDPAAGTGRGPWWAQGD